MKSSFVKFAMSSLCGTFMFCNVYAFKFRIYSFPEQVTSADKIVVGVMTPMNSKIHIVVQEYLKGGGNHELNVKYDCLRDADRVAIQENERAILFLCDGKDGEFRLLGYGDQCIWPKKHAKWPFASSHVCTEQDIIIATTNIINIDNEPIMENRIEKLRQMLASNELFMRTVATEYIGQRVNKGGLSQMEHDLRLLVSHECDAYLKELGASVLNKIRRLTSINDRPTKTNSSNRVNGSAMRDKKLKRRK